MRNEDLGNGDRYYVRNLIGGPIEVDCRFESADNVEANPPLPRRLILAARAEQILTFLHSADPTKDSGASVECAAFVGDPGAKPRDDVNYVLPFYPGTEFTLDQGFNGEYSHHDPESRYSLDLGVAEGTPVLAARDGVVMQVEQNFRGRGLDAARFGDRANYVRVLHSDGSMALYAHLVPQSTLFRPGDKVRVGNFLGKAGTTGFTTGPHLHFSVQKNAGMSLQSIPFTMTGVDPYNPR
jgi:murein DD-endopeptidase MepM/ murein hydrolase activator NlpD